MASEERELIKAFVRGKIRKKAGNRLALTTVLGAYKVWRKKTGLSPTRMSIDAFGKNFPQTHPRRVIWVDKKLCRGLEGYELV